MSHYDTLGVPRDASPDQIKRAYRRKAAKAHPDKGGSAEDMAALNRAKDCLNDPALRLGYDQTGNDGRGPAIEEQAQVALMALFESLLNLSQGQILRAATTAAQSQLSQAKQARTSMEIARRNLMAKRAQVWRAATGPDAFALVLDKHINAIDVGLTTNDGQQQVMRRLLELLKEYAEQPAPSSPFGAEFDMRGNRIGAQPEAVGWARSAIFTAPGPT